MVSTDVGNQFYCRTARRRPPPEYENSELLEIVAQYDEQVPSNNIYLSQQSVQCNSSGNVGPLRLKSLCLIFCICAEHITFIPRH